jgi:hypothetical protein
LHHRLDPFDRQMGHVARHRVGQLAQGIREIDRILGIGSREVAGPEMIDDLNSCERQRNWLASSEPSPESSPTNSRSPGPFPFLDAAVRCSVAVGVVSAGFSGPSPFFPASGHSQRRTCSATARRRESSIISR